MQLRVASTDDAPKLRRLLNAAYKELADLGLNYTASYQDEADTLAQIAAQTIYVLEDAGELVATVSVRAENHFTNRKTLYVRRFAVEPSRKRQGLGRRLLNFVEEHARTTGYEGLQLDTAKPAHHLVAWYQRLGFRIVGEDAFEGKTYESWVFEKLF